MPMSSETTKLPFKIKLSYSMGQIGDSLGYNMYFFFFFFLDRLCWRATSFSRNDFIGSDFMGCCV